MGYCVELNVDPKGNKIIKKIFLNLFFFFLTCVIIWSNAMMTMKIFIESNLCVCVGHISAFS